MVTAVVIFLMSVSSLNAFLRLQQVFLQQGDRPRICPVCNAEVPENKIVVDKYLEKVFASARKKHDSGLEAIFFYLETSGISSKLMWKPVIEGRAPGTV